MRQFIFFLVFIININAMEPVPARTYQVPPLQTLCLRRIRDIVSTYKPLYPFDRDQNLFQTQQDAATVVEQGMHPELKIALKAAIVKKYKTYLESSPWALINSPFDMVTLCTNQPLFFCDYCPPKKWYVTYQKDKTNKASLMIHSLKNKAVSTVANIDVRHLEDIQKVSFSPCGSYLQIVYNDTQRKLGYAFIPLIEDPPCALSSLQYHTPLKDTVHYVSARFTGDDKYLFLHSLHALEIIDMQKLVTHNSCILPIMYKIKRCYKDVVLSPMEYFCAALDHQGTVAVYALKDGKLYYIASFLSGSRSTRIEWLPCGTRLLVQGATPVYWDPICGTKKNITDRLPRIIFPQVAHSPCGNYLVYQSITDLCILHNKSQKVRHIKNYFALAMWFDEQGTLLTQGADGMVHAWRVHDHQEMPIAQLLALVCISRGILHENKHNSLAQLLSTTNALIATTGFRDLPHSIQQEYLEKIRQKLQQQAQGKDKNAHIQMLQKGGLVHLCLDYKNY